MTQSYKEIWPIVQKIIADADRAENPEMPDFVSVIDESIRRMQEPEESMTMPGWAMFNSLTGGIRPSEFTIVCGPTGAGKTTWLANLAAELLVAHIPHYVASVETGPHDFVIRTISAIDGQDYNTGQAVPAETIERLKREYGPILKSRDMFLSLYETKVDPRRMLCDLYYARKEKGAKIAILDNLNFFNPIVESREAIASMDRTLHDFVMLNKAIGLHTFLVMHPRKTDGGRVESEFDIKGSSTAVQEASNVLLLNRPTAEDEELKGYDRRMHRELKFAKIRRRGINSGKRIMYKSNGAVYAEVETF
jgi:energy-coupling factor transporter ATP-binding protein EcfA2